MTVVFLEKFLRDIEKLKDKKTKLSVKNAILRIEEANSLSEITNWKKLKGEKNAYRLRIGAYRLGFYLN